MSNGGRAMVTENTMHDNSNMSVMMALPETVYDPAWYLDSGATNHITPDPANLFSKSFYNGDNRIRVANGEPTHIHHIGNSFFFPPNSIKPIVFQNLLHVLDITKNLMSVPQFT